MVKQKLKSALLGITVAACVISSAATAHDSDEAPAYPTAVLADYVLACMSANGNGYETLHKCSCSMDYISERMTYEDYEKVQTVMSVGLDRGQRGVFFRDSNWAKTMIERLENLQAESTLRCF